MDKALRSLLECATKECRELLQSDFRDLLEGRYGLLPDRAQPLETLVHLDALGLDERRRIEGAIAHFRPTESSAEAAFERYVRESAFTFLHRLTALKLFEHPARKIVPQVAGEGRSSRGFRDFLLVAGDAVSDEEDGGYRFFLRLLFDDLALVLPPLFSRAAATTILFPTVPVLDAVLAILNDPALAEAWGLDEAIGWIYQYFTPGELRQKARKEAAAPRDSHELSFRNQFYTPRYVVDFLAQNTLGRLWWTMRGGETALAETCPYLITRGANERPASRDPRSLRILDPACGSGHFLLACFDLLETIYAEAYSDPGPGPALQAEFPDEAAYRKLIPRLILAHNLHGIDIDPRAVQIAKLALWLRAQRGFAERGLPVRERPRIEDIPIVLAEPMPGETDLLAEFAANVQPAALGEMLRLLWGEMRLAGELGSLLKIEHALADAVRRTRARLNAIPEYHQITLFGADHPAEGSVLRRADLDDDAFWADAESRLREALGAFAGTLGTPVTRRLFAADALEGLTLMDLLRAPFDVALMNPPFGAPVPATKAYLEKHYPRTKHDLYAAFIERGLELLRPGGMLGAITSRTGFFLTTFKAWREEILLKEAQFIAMADLGYGVLDTAMVETAAYVLRKRESDDA